MYVYVYIYVYIYIPRLYELRNMMYYLNSSTRVQSLRLGFLNAFQSLGFGKRAEMVFSKPEVFLRTEVKIVTATKEEKGKLFSL